MNYEICIISRSEVTYNSGKIAAEHLGWKTIGSTILASDSPAELSEVLEKVLPSIAAVYFIGNGQPIPDVIRARANEFECECFTWEDRVSTRLEAASTRVTKSTKSHRVCLLLNSSSEPNIASIETALLIKSIVDTRQNEEVPFEQNEDVPFERLYSLYFSHVQHEANWVNSRFMWFMFANSALISLFGVFLASRWQVLPIATGMIYSWITLRLQRFALSAEERMLTKCADICVDWKSAVPDIAKYLIATPAGGDSLIDHWKAKRLMLSIPIIFIFIWVFLAFYCWVNWDSLAFLPNQSKTH